MKLLNHLDDLIILASLVSIVYSAFLVDQALGYFAAGVAGLVATSAMAASARKPPENKSKV